MTLLEALNVRHSVRKYSDIPLDHVMTQSVNAEIFRLNTLGSLNMQLVLNEPRAFKSLLAYGIFSGVRNYVVVAGQKSPDLDCRAGYYAEQLVLFCQSIGLNTCIVGLTYRRIPEAFSLPDGERIVVCIALGYGAEQGRSHKIKSPEQVSNISPDSPLWFRHAVEAALKAPTAVNQQKFFFKYLPPSSESELPGVRPSTLRSIVGYTKVDLGIAMRNFEIGAEPQKFRWIEPPFQKPVP